MLKNMRTEGYRLIEPEHLSPLSSDKEKHEFAVAILYWLVPQLYEELKTELANTELDVAIGGRFGFYPCLGIRYPEMHKLDAMPLEKLVEATANRLFEETPISELISFMADTGINWKERTRELIEG